MRIIQKQDIEAARPFSFVRENPDGTFTVYDEGETPPPLLPTLADLKQMRLQAHREECRDRLTTFYGDAVEQVSRASGVYGAVAQERFTAGVQATITASNIARDLINAATTPAEVEAVTVAWPVLQ